jgi:hypothetical protein
VGVDAEQEMLQDYGMPVLGGSESGPPALARFFPPLVALEGIEVTVGKRYVEAFHTRSILEATSEDTFVDFARNVAVESSEVTESALLTPGEVDRIIKTLQDLFDRTGGHKTPTALLVEYRKPGEPLPAELVPLFEGKGFRRNSPQLLRSV